MTINAAIVNCAVRSDTFTLRLEADEDALTGCWMLGRTRKKPDEALPKGWLRDAAHQLKSYCAGKLDALDLPLTLKGTPFQQTVWDAARTIPAGEVRSYQWLAQKVGNPRAVRAVAGALGANPALLFVPCHRVLRTNGDLGGFSCGVEWKVLLLQHEGQQLL